MENEKIIKRGNKGEKKRSRNKKRLLTKKEKSTNYLVS